MNYKNWSKQFDDRFSPIWKCYDLTNPDGDVILDKGITVTNDVKDFIKETINALCDELKMEAKTNGKVNITKLSGFHDAGYDTAVGRFNKKLERIRNETR